MKRLPRVWSTVHERRRGALDHVAEQCKDEVDRVMRVATPPVMTLVIRQMEKR